MKLSADIRQQLAERISQYDSEQTRNRYRTGQFPRADRVQDVNRRYRWDLFYAAKGYELMPDDIVNAHIDTALRRIVAPL
jgi:hypothetical protein